ncbi:MAG: 23S rRNA (uracil(1939)-C(5))-methyltransferase RlmD [Elusimicrobia bacterium]|nr:23S rRNA (uracil(1939)-C(5))-methyltransferase RlmD [Elusimicrobiota bacterium]
METLTVRVERMAPEGSGIGRSPRERSGSALDRAQGQVVFVPFAAPGDLLEVEVTASKSTFLRTRVLKVLEPGLGRVLPRCPLHFDPSRPGPACGGCDWQHLDYGSQLAAKKEIVADALRRIAKAGAAEVAPVKPSPLEWAYRNKVQVPFGKGPGASPIAGFYACGSHSIVPLEACPVQTDLSVAILRRVRELAGKLGWRPYEEHSGRGWLRHLYIRTNADNQAIAAIVTRDPSLPGGPEFIREMRSRFHQLVGLYQNVQPMKTSVILGPTWKTLWGSRGLTERIGRLRFFSSPGSFMQVNTGAAALLYDEALSALTEGGRTFPLVFDVYCGVGTISLWVAGAADRVLGIEENRAAVQDAILNCRTNDIRNVRFQAGRAEGLLSRAVRETPGPAAAIVDPPRSGLTPPVLRCLTAGAIRRVVYVSCDPATFARDAGYLLRSGFRLRRVQPLDLFPQTSHVEIVGLLDRS